MSYEQYLYHSERERHCRELGERATDAEVRQRHFELADLHASRAANYNSAAGASVTQMQGLSAA